MADIIALVAQEPQLLFTNRLNPELVEASVEILYSWFEAAAKEKPS
jgi:hypothetical protein